MNAHLSRRLMLPLTLPAAVLLLALTVMACSSGSSSSSVTSPSPTVGGGGPAASGGNAGADQIAGFNPHRLYQQSTPSTVLVISSFSGGQALGSGFVVRNGGYIVTNEHVVVENGAKAQSVQVGFKDANGERQAPAQIVGVDASIDIAVLRVSGQRNRSVAPLPLGNSTKVQVGEPVVAIGNPLGFSFSLTAGVVSGTGRDLAAPNGAIIVNGIQTDAAINQGNSGGPLIDAGGNVIGVNEQIASPTGGFTGLGFAVPVNSVKRVLGQLISRGRVTYAYLGIEGQTITSVVAQVLNLPVDHGVLVATVRSGSPAAAAGLRGGNATRDVQGQPFVTGGDIITKLNGKRLAGMDDLIAAIQGMSVGETVRLTVVTDGRTHTVDVTLAARPANF